MAGMSSIVSGLKRITPRKILTAVMALVAICLACAMISHTQAHVDAANADDPFAVVSPEQATPASDFTLKTSAGQSVSLSQAYSKGPVVLDFWATWCGPCKMELPELKAVYDKYKGQGVQFYGINSDASAEQINHFFSQTGLLFPMLVDTGGTVATSYNVTGIPYVLVIDRSGKVRAESDGFDPDTQKDLSNALDTLLKEH